MGQWDSPFLNQVANTAVMHWHAVTNLLMRPFWYTGFPCQSTMKFPFAIRST
jgi:hypothetical protein